jgi:cytochrome c oxidase subunit II
LINLYRHRVVCFALAFAMLLSLGCHSAASAPADAPRQQVDIVMKKWSIEPHEIHVKKGTVVTLHVSTADVQHGFEVQSLGISEPVNPGKPADITFVADKPGKYGVDCDILCGKGHDDMAATIIVE